MPDFKPTLVPIHEKSPFRFWCQKVLPTVYDDSLSYYELVNKIVIYLNENTEDLETVNGNVEALYNAFVNLQNYVNQYFDQNFPELVEEKLDEMVTDGTFDRILGELSDQYFAVKSEEIDDAISAQNTNVNRLMSEWENFIMVHGGLTTETKINHNNVTAEGDTWIFTDDIDNYRYIEFHHALSSASINPIITRVVAEDLLSYGANQKLTFVYTPNANSSDKSIVAYMFELTPIMDTSDPENVHPYKDRLYINKAVKWEWDGSINPATITHAVTGTSTDTLCGFLLGAYGIKDEQNDAEVVDARVGYNGTTYTTLGTAIRTQVQNLHNLIAAIDAGTLTVNIDGTDYVVRSISKATESGVAGWKYILEDGTLEGLPYFFPDGVGLNTVLTSVTGQIPVFSTNLQDDTIDVTIGQDVYKLIDNHRFEHDIAGVLYQADVKSNPVANNTKPINSIALMSYAEKKKAKTTVSGATVTQAIDSNTFYVFGEVTSLALTFNTPTDNAIVNEYHFRFTSGATPTALTLPSGVVMNTPLTPQANKVYEVSIIDNYGVWCEW